LAEQPMRPDDVTLETAETVIKTFEKMVSSCPQLAGIGDRALRILGGLHGEAESGDQDELAQSMVDLIKHKLRQERGEG